MASSNPILPSSISSAGASSSFPNRPVLPSSSCSPHQIRLQLSQSTQDLLERGLKSSAKWCAEWLNALPSPTSTHEEQSKWGDPESQSQLSGQKGSRRGQSTSGKESSSSLYTPSSSTQHGTVPVPSASINDAGFIAGDLNQARTRKRTRSRRSSSIPEAPIPSLQTSTPSRTSSALHPPSLPTITSTSTSMQGSTKHTSGHDGTNGPRVSWDPSLMHDGNTSHSFVGRSVGGIAGTGRGRHLHPRDSIASSIGMEMVLEDDDEDDDGVSFDELEEDEDEEAGDDNNRGGEGFSTALHQLSTVRIRLSRLRQKQYDQLDRQEQNIYTLGLCYLQNHEHLRCAFTLRNCKGKKARWLWGYSKYLAGERISQESTGELLGPRDHHSASFVPSSHHHLHSGAHPHHVHSTPGATEGGGTAPGGVNPFADEILQAMSRWEQEDEELQLLTKQQAFQERHLNDSNMEEDETSEAINHIGYIDGDGYLLFLKALLFLCLPALAPVLLYDMPMSSGTRTSTNSGAYSNEGDLGVDLRLAAMEALVKSVNLQPYNWTAWLKIASCLDGPEELETTLKFLPSVFPLLFFFVHATLEIHAAGDNLHESLDDLETIFGENCSMIKGMRGLIHYHVREFDEATVFFTDLQKTEPYRVEDIDIFSNILYVSEKRAELAKLAQDYTRMDRSRPEVCCLIGNYYSLRREHEKAIIYFRRALKLDRGYLSAWTLMGHEYVEIKNTNAAIASYRRAVDVNRKDYRAWYGLGQTYELLGEPFYALSYYQKATALRPYDARMWAALAVCYEKLKRVPDAIKAYQRALVSSEPGESDTALRIGRLYALLGQSHPAAQYHRRALLEGVKSGLPKNELSKIWLWLARFELRKEMEFRAAAAAAAAPATVAEAAGNRQIRQSVIPSEEGDLQAAEGYLKQVMTVQEDKEEAKALLQELSALLLDRE